MTLVSVVVAMKEVVFAILYFIAPITERVFTKMLINKSLFRLPQLFLIRACISDRYRFPVVK